MAAGSTMAIGMAAAAFVMLLLMVAALFLFLDSLEDAKVPNPPGGATSTSSTKPVNTSVFGGGTGKKRVYTSGVRLEELLFWSALEAPEALVAYCAQMEGDEREALFSALPQVTSCILGLESGLNTPKGWLNEQANLLLDGPHKSVRNAQQLAQKLLDLLVAATPPSGGGNGAGGAAAAALSPMASAKAAASSSSSPGGGLSNAFSAFGGGGGGIGAGAASSSAVAARRTHGVLLEKLIDAGRGPEGGMRYTFFARWLPPPARLALQDGKVALLPPLFATRVLQSVESMGGGGGGGGGIGGAGAGRPGQGGRGGSTEPPASLVLAAWEYFLFCFCLWPLSDGGERSLDLAAPVTPPGSSGAAAATSFLGSMVGGGADTGPLYFTLLDTYLNHFLPPGRPAAEGGELLLAALAQFWLGQNAPPYVAQQLSHQPLPFQDTKASVLQCLDRLVRHLNEHEVQRVRVLAAVGQPLPSAHAALLPHMYHFFDKQMHNLPDISARVISLCRLVVRYLEPWRPPPTTAKAGSGGGAGGGAGGGGVGRERRGGRCTLCRRRRRRAGAVAVSSAAAAAAAEAWPWAPFVRSNYLLFARVLVRLASEVRLSRFRLSEKRDLIMLREVAKLFDHAHVLTLMRQLGENLEQLLSGALPPASPMRECLVAQLSALEGDPSRWRAACEPYLPAKVYHELNGMDVYLQGKADDLKKAQAQKSFFDAAAGGGGSSGGLSPMAVIDELRRCAQRAMRELQPSGHEAAPAQPVHTHRERPSISLIGGGGALAAATMVSGGNAVGSGAAGGGGVGSGAGGAGGAVPLSREQKAALLAGRARCSALSVGYRATPRLPVRPIGRYEVAPLVEIAERLGAVLPPAVRRTGLHPRVLASVPSLCLTAVYAILIGVRPTAPPIAAPPDDALPYDDGDAHVALLLLWWVLFLPSLAFGALHLRHWARQHAPSLRATAESWVPWVAEQLQRGVDEVELKDYLRRALPVAAVAEAADEAERMLSLAKDRAQCGRD